MGMKTSIGSPEKAGLGPPGPGQYNSINNFRNISYSFGLKTGSALNTKAGAPGPGQYNVGGGHSKVGGSVFGSEKRLNTASMKDIRN